MYCLYLIHIEFILGYNKLRYYSIEKEHLSKHYALNKWQSVFSAQKFLADFKLL